MSGEPALMSLVEVAAAIATRRLSSHEVTRAVLHRIAQWQPRLNAFMEIEAEAALKAADEADARRCSDGQSGLPAEGDVLGAQCIGSNGADSRDPAATTTCARSSRPDQRTSAIV